MKFSPRILAALLTVYIIWGSTYLAVGFAVETIPPMYLMGLRFGIAGAIMFVVLRLGGVPNPSRRHWRNTFLAGALIMSIGQGFVAYAAQWIGPGVLAVAMATLPVWTVVFASFVERLPARLEVAGLLLGIGGVVLLNLDGEMWAEPAGAIALVIAPLAWGLGSIVTRHIDLPGRWMSAACMLLGASVVAFALGIISGSKITQIPSLKSSLAFVFLVLFSSIVALSAYLYLLTSTSPAIANSHSLTSPVIAVILGALFARETITALTIIATILILVAVLAINLSGAKRVAAQMKR